MVGTTNDNIESNSVRGDILRQQLEGVIDHELQELGFANLCKKIAFKVVEKVQKIDNEHSEIKSIYGELGVRLANLLVESDNDKCPSPPARNHAEGVTQNYEKRRDSNDKCVIVIDDDEEANAKKFKSTPNKSHPESYCSEFCVSSHSNISPCTSLVNTRPPSITLPRASTAPPSSHTPNKNVVSNNAAEQVVAIYKNDKITRNDITENDSTDIVCSKDGKKLLPSHHTPSHSSEFNLSNSQENEVNKSNAADDVNFDVNPLSPPLSCNIETSEFMDEDISVPNLIHNEDNALRNQLNDLDSNIKHSEASPLVVANSAVSQLDKTDSDDLGDHSRSPLILKITVTENPIAAETTSKYSSTMLSHSTEKPVKPVNNKQIQETLRANSISKAKKKVFKFKAGAIVYAKPCGSDIWFEAELLREIISTTNKQAKYQVRFMGGQRLRQKILQKSMATKDAAHIDNVKLGTRIVAGRPSDTVNTTISKKYKDISSGNNINVMFAGVVAELACEANRYRYLVFFDDGYAQYFNLTSLFLVAKPSNAVWNDVAVDCQEFIKEYLQDYPYRPLVCTTINNTMQTEWNGEWWKSKVVSIDASLIKMLFDVDKRSEWIYRGTTRLEPLYNHFLQPKPAKKKKKFGKSPKEDVYVDEKITHPQFGICKYSLKDPDGVQQRKEWNLPSVKFKRVSSGDSTSVLDLNKFPGETESDKIMPKKLRIESGIEVSKGDMVVDRISTISSREAFGVVGALQMSPTTNAVSAASHVNASSAKKSLYTDDEISDKAPNQIVQHPKPIPPPPFKPAVPILPKPPVASPERRGPHLCNPSCIKERKKLIDEHRHGIFNYLSIPFKLGWKRESSKKKTGWHRDIYYRSPCNRRLRNLAEITTYILLTKCTNACIDMFCFQSNISCRNQPLKPKPPLAKIDDLSGGKETCPIVCVNEITEELPNPIVYISNRLKAEDVSINTDPGFLVCCDCIDNCQDKSKCGCAQLTVESSNAIDDVVNPNAGYQYRRLKETITTGIYECNQNCSCSRETCYNRVVQNGIQLRLQVFMTENRGWGLRCIDDIPKGTFICTYAGQVLNEQTANREGMDFGDEYLAELDHIEVVGKAKDDYESDVPELRDNINISSDDDSDSDSSSSVITLSSDTSDSDEDDTRKKQKVVDELPQVEKLPSTPADVDASSSESTDSLPTVENDALEWTEGKSYLTPCHVPIQRIPSADWPSRMDSTSCDSLSEDLPPASPLIDFDLSTSLQDLNTDESRPMSNDITDNLSVVVPHKKLIVPDKKDNSDIAIHNIGNDLTTFSGKAVAIKSTSNKAYAHKSTGGKRSGKASTVGKPDVPVTKTVSNPLPTRSFSDGDKSSTLSTRSLYDGDKQMYVIDAKCFGNVGRFMNHSCSPNLFVQNVMVDTHDLRFPWVAFFAQQNIQSYTELTWDYNYEIGSVPDKTLLCKCGAKNCKGRLL